MEMPSWQFDILLWILEQVWAGGRHLGVVRVRDWVKSIKRVGVDREAERFRTKNVGYFHIEVGRWNQ